MFISACLPNVVNRPRRTEPSREARCFSGRCYTLLPALMPRPLDLFSGDLVCFVDFFVDAPVDLWPLEVQQAAAVIVSASIPNAAAAAGYTSQRLTVTWRPSENTAVEYPIR